MAVKTQNRIESLSVLLDGSSDGKMLLKEAYDGVLENVQKGAVSVQLKNTDLSGDPLAGTVEAKRFANATAQNYGTARTGDGLVAKRSANHAQRLIAELDTKFFEVGETEGTEFKHAIGVTEIQEIVESAILHLETLKNDYIDGLDRSMLQIVFDPDTYSKMRMYLDKVVNTNVDTTTEEFFYYHGVRCHSSNRLPEGVKFEAMMTESIAQPIRSVPYTAERIPLSEAVAVEMFFYYGTKAVTPETIIYYSGNEQS